MGIALPPWIVEAHNNAWVLGFYGILFGVGLPIVVVCNFFPRAEDLRLVSNDFVHSSINGGLDLAGRPKMVFSLRP
jgi:preprotein translocase subunit Sec63